MVKKALGVSFEDAKKEIEKVLNINEPQKINNEKQIDPNILRKLYRESKPITRQDLAGRYLKNRGLLFIENTGLRFHPSVYEPETRTKMPCLLATFKNNGKAITLHRIFLDEYGQKAPIEKPKKTMPVLGKMAGGAIELAEYDEVLGIAEGIETALAVMLYFEIPCWATLNSTLLEQWNPPAVKKIYIFGDNDKSFTGQKAAYTLANKIYKYYRVEVMIPEEVGSDWLDIYNKEKNLTCNL